MKRPPPPRPASRLVLIAHIDGEDQDDGIAPPPIGMTARTDFCRGIWLTVIRKPPDITLDRVVETLDREVPETTPYLTVEMEKKHPWSRYNIFGCKMAGSEEWRFIRNGKDFGQNRWVYLGRYTPGAETHPEVEIRSIPNHRRSRFAKEEGRKVQDSPVNRYDAALLPTPGDVSKMTGMGKTGADSVAAVVEAVTERLLTAPIPLETGEILTFRADGSLTRKDPQTGGTDADSWKVWSDAEERVILEYGSTRLIDEEIAAFLRRLPKNLKRPRP